MCCKDRFKVWFSSPKYVKIPTPCTICVVTSKDGLSIVATSLASTMVSGQGVFRPVH